MARFQQRKITEINVIGCCNLNTCHTDNEFKQNEEMKDGRKDIKRESERKNASNFTKYFSVTCKFHLLVIELTDSNTQTMYSFELLTVILSTKYREKNKIK